MEQLGNSARIPMRDVAARYGVYVRTIERWIEAIPSLVFRSPYTSAGAAVMAEAEAPDDVELTAVVVPHFRLHDRIAPRLERARLDLLMIRKANLFFGDVSQFAGYRDNLEAMTF